MNEIVRSIRPNNQPQQLRCSDRKALAGLRPVGLEPIRMQTTVIRVHAQKVETKR